MEARSLRQPAFCAILVVALLAFAACSQPVIEPADSESGEATIGMEPESLQIDTDALTRLGLSYESVEIRELTPSLELPAEIVAVPDRVASITTTVAGRVVAVAANVGDRVMSGDPLVVLSSTEVGRVRAQIVAARARVEVATRAAERATNLQRVRVGSERAVEEAGAQLRVAEAELQAAQTRLRTYGASLEYAADADPAGVSLETPLTGTVVERTATVGQWAEVTDQLLVIVDLEALWLQAQVYERDMRFIELGQEVRIQVRAFPGEVFVGHVEQIAGQLDEATRSVAVRALLPNDDLRLRPGMFATARILGTHAHDPRNLLTIPWSAVQEMDGHHIVFVRPSEGMFEPRRVHTGERAAAFVEVLSGLQAGEVVVVDGSVLLKAQLLRSTLGEEE